MPSFGALGRSHRPPGGDPAFADTVIIPVLVPGPLDRPALLLRPSRAPRVAARGTARTRIAALAGGVLALAGLALLGGLGFDGGRLHRPGTEVAAVPAARPAAAQSPAAGPALPAPLGRVAEVAPPAMASANSGAPAVGASAPAGVRPPPAPLQRHRGSGVPRQPIATLQHEWEVAEAMRLRYRELHAQGLVSWEAWRAQENEALRLRLKLQARRQAEPG